jgi:exonuclease VII small subunit
MATLKYLSPDENGQTAWQFLDVVEEKAFEEKVEKLEKIKSLEERIGDLENKINSLERGIDAINSTLNEHTTILSKLVDENGNPIINSDDINSFTIAPSSDGISTNKFWIDSSPEGKGVLKYFNPVSEKWEPISAVWG